MESDIPTYNCHREPCFQRPPSFSLRRETSCDRGSLCLSFFPSPESLQPSTEADPLPEPDPPEKTFKPTAGAPEESVIGESESSPVGDAPQEPAISPNEAGLRNTSRRSYPLIRAIFAQLTAAALVIGGQQILGSRADLVLPLPALLAIQGLVAAGLGQIMGLARWWLPVNLLLPAAAALALALQLPGWVYLLLFLALALVFWNSAGDRVPLYLTNRTTWQALEELLQAEAQRKDAPLEVADMGCGLGGALLYLARRCPEHRFTGVESAPLPFALARLRQAFSGLDNLTIRYGNLWNQDLGRYDLLYCFLSPEPMPRLYEKAKREMQTGSLLVSNSFVVPEITPEATLQLEDRRETRLLLYRF